MKQQLQTKLICRLATDQTVCTPRLKRTRKIKRSASQQINEQKQGQKKLKKNHSHFVEGTFDMSWTSIWNVFANSIPHGHEIRHNSTKLVKSHTPSDHTSAQLSDILHPGLLQSSTQSQHNKINHRGHFQHSKDLLMCHTITMQENFGREFPSKDETTTTWTLIANNTQKGRTHTTDTKGHQPRRETRHHPRQRWQLGVWHTLTKLLHIHTQTQQGIAFSRVNKAILSVGPLFKRHTVLTELCSSWHHRSKDPRKKSTTN